MIKKIKSFFINLLLGSNKEKIMSLRNNPYSGEYYRRINFILQNSKLCKEKKEELIKIFGFEIHKKIKDELIRQELFYKDIKATEKKYQSNNIKIPQERISELNDLKTKYKNDIKKLKIIIEEFNLSIFDDDNQNVHLLNNLEDFFPDIPERIRAVKDVLKLY